MAITHGVGGTAITGDDIQVFHLLQLKHAMRLEMKGMRHSRGSVFAYVKRTFNLKGNKQRVYDQFIAMHPMLEQTKEN